ncbi:hypothetical protein O5853_31865, partial [Escherichia coli]|nr:hypothetical protein [Escherichia coli]
TIMDPDPDSAVISRFFESLNARVWLPECWDWRREIAHSDPIQLTHGLLRTPRFCVALENATLWQSPAYRACVLGEQKNA